MAAHERRNPFGDPSPPEPFYRTSEFRRGVALLGLLAAAGVFAFWRLASHTTSSEEKPPEQFEPARELTAEEQAERERRLYTVFEGALSDSKNGQDFAETGGYRRLMELVASFPADDFHAKATQWLDAERARATPDALRGEFVRARGVLAGYWTQRLERPILGHQDVWRGVIAGTEIGVDDGVVLDVLDRPADLIDENVRGPAVDVEGIFYRTVTYEAENGKVRTAPWLVARNLRTVEREAGVRDWLAQNTVSVIALCVFVILAARLLISWFQRRQRAASMPRGSPTIREMMDQRVAEMRRREPPPAPPSST